jgi:putative nucleotidyltransferase with HDIG domain
MSKRIQDLTSPVTRVRKAVWETAARPFRAMSPDQRFWLGFGFLCLLTTILINNPFWRASVEQPYKEGEIARETIISPADIYFSNDEETEGRRRAARETIKPMFYFESKRPDEAVQTFRSAWENLGRRDSGQAANRTNSNIRGDTQWTGAGGAELGKIFAARNFSTNELDAITRILRENASGDIYGDQDKPYLENEISIIDRQRPNSSREVKKPDTTMIALSEARNRLHDGLLQIKSLSEKEVEAFNSALSPLVQPSVIFDSTATESSRAAAASNIQPIVISLKRGEKVADEGAKITPDTLSKVAAIRNYSSSTRQVNRFVGLLILISGLFWAAWKFIQHRGIVPRLALSPEKTFALFGFITLVQTALNAVFFRLAEFTALQNVRVPLNDPTLWCFAIPFAFGSLLMTLLADRRTALFTGLFNALIAGLLAPRGLEFAIYASIVSSVAVYGIGRYRSRQTITIAGALVGISSAGLAIALIAYTQQPFILNTVALSIACALASGIITAAITAVFMPVCESIFGILTDVKLLELSNADLPALGQLAMRAPGTNQHSHAVGQLAEEACRVVGGNGLLARIGALYHDIGKTAAPEHFVENQMGKNPHDRLKPAQSAKIIISHVTYGVKLAREMGLPSRIIDFIPQHHGTRTLHFFLKKAQAEARPDEEFVENDFRYPGPKPQFREAAIMMIADSCEAAARSLAEPTPENIRFIVTKIIDAILSDDQLDECDLTLRELTQIRESMIKSLVAIYHSRVDYPGYIPPNSQPRIAIPEDSIPDSDDRGARYADPADIPISKGGEIEDEAVVHSIPPDKADAKSVK